MGLGDSFINTAVCSHYLLHWLAFTCCHAAICHLRGTVQEQQYGGLFRAQNIPGTLINTPLVKCTGFDTYNAQSLFAGIGNVYASEIDMGYQLLVMVRS
jgi:hypothetical protein